MSFLEPVTGTKLVYSVLPPENNETCQGTGWKEEFSFQVRNLDV